MAKTEKRVNPIILKAGMTIGANAAEMDDEYLLPCFVSYRNDWQLLDRTISAVRVRANRLNSRPPSPRDAVATLQAQSALVSRQRFSCCIL